MTGPSEPTLENLAAGAMWPHSTEARDALLARELIALRKIVCAEDGVLMRLNAIEASASSGGQSAGSVSLALAAEMQRERDEARRWLVEQEKLTDSLQQQLAAMREALARIDSGRTGTFQHLHYEARQIAFDALYPEASTPANTEEAGS